jgi:hypothetical protein
MKGFVLALLLPASTTAVASQPPPLPKQIAANANDLQRAVWACEAGARYLAPGSKTTSVPPRFFLGSVSAGGALADKLPLVLDGGHLSGLGRLSTDQGWSTIRFECALSSTLGQATAFTFESLSPITEDRSEAPPPAAARARGARMSWYVEGADTPTLVHGIRQTDDRDFAASCVAHSGNIKVALTNTVRWLKAENYVTVSLSNGPGSGLYVARGVMDDNLAATVPVFTVNPDDPLVGWMTAGRSLLINIGGDLAYDVPLTGSARAVRRFEAACRR